MSNVTQTPTTPPVRTFSSFQELKAAQPPMQEMEPCPVCGYRKPKEITVGGAYGKKVRPLVCKGCSDRYHQYGAEVATKLAKGEPVVVLSRHGWVLSQMDLASFERELEVAAAEKNRLNTAVQERLQAHGHLPREVFQPLRDRLQEEIGARRAYGIWRRFDERLKAARTVRPEVEKMVADEATRNSTPAPAPPAEAKTAKPKKGK